MAAKSKLRKIKVAPYDSADYLKTEADIKNYLEAVFEEPMVRIPSNVDSDSGPSWTAPGIRRQPPPILFGCPR